MSATLRQALLVAGLLVQQTLSFTPGVVLASHVRVPPAASPSPAEGSHDANREVLTEWVDYAAEAEERRHRKKYSQIRQGIFGTHPNLFRMLCSLAGGNAAPQYAFALMSGRGWKYIQAMATVSFRDVRSQSGQEWVPIVDIAEVVVRPKTRKPRALKNEIIRQVMRLYGSSDRTVVITPPRLDKDYYESRGFRPLAMKEMEALPPRVGAGRRGQVEGRQASSEGGGRGGRRRPPLGAGPRRRRAARGRR